MAGGGPWPPLPLFQGWHTHFCLVLSKKQRTCQFYLFAIAFHQFWVKNMLVSLLLSSKLTVFCLALLEIDCFLPVVHHCFFVFTDAVPLISGRGLKFCARIISCLGPLMFNMLLPPMLYGHLDACLHCMALLCIQLDSVVVFGSFFLLSVWSPWQKPAHI